MLTLFFTLFTGIGCVKQSASMDTPVALLFPDQQNFKSPVISQVMQEEAWPTPVDPELAFRAQELYQQANYLEKAFYNIKISGPQGSCDATCAKLYLKEMIATKQNQLRKNEKRYQDIVDLKAGIWSLNSIIKIGQLYEEYANGIQHAWIPGFLSAGSRKIYAETMEKKAFKVKLKAIKYYEKGFGISKRQNLITPELLVGVKRLKELLVVKKGREFKQNAQLSRQMKIFTVLKIKVKQARNQYNQLLGCQGSAIALTEVNMYLEQVESIIKENNIELAKDVSPFLDVAILSLKKIQSACVK